MYLAVMILNLNTLNNSNFLFGKFGFSNFQKIIICVFALQQNLNFQNLVNLKF